MKFGCDEAGRGPVLGSMFVACVYGDENEIPSDVDDSKNLTQNQIESLDEDIRSSELSVSVVEVTPNEIDSSDSLTELSAEAFAMSIVKAGVKPETEGYVDCFANTEKRAEEMISDYLNDDYELRAEFSADEARNHVSAASIVAKASRERHVDELSSSYGDIGSGYPSDPNTKNFLSTYFEENGELPSFTRLSWSTAQNILNQSN